MAKITFRLGPGRDKTNVRIAKSYYPYKFIEYLKTKSDFEYKGTNKINHVFVYLGTVENAEFNLKSHYTVFKNMNKKLNQYFFENKNKGELKIMNKKEFIGKAAFNVLQKVIKHNSENEIENWNDLNQERKTEVLRTVETVFNNPEMTSSDMYDDIFITTVKQLKDLDADKLNDFDNFNAKVLRESNSILRSTNNTLELTNKMLSDDNEALRKNNRILLNERIEYMEITEKQRKMIIQLEKENKELRKK